MNVFRQNLKNTLGNIGASVKPIKIAVSAIKKSNRRKFEKVCDDMNPTCGSIIKIINNFSDTVVNASDSTVNGLTRSYNNEEYYFEIGEHIYVQRCFYTHHGIYVGNGRVIHYLKERVSETSINSFADGAKVFKKTEKQSPRHFLKKEAIKRAYSRLGENNYNLAINNCDSFVRWCRNGADQRRGNLA